MLDWRNSDRIRANMFSDHIITMEEHVAWFEGTQRDDKIIVLVLEYLNEPIGVVNITDIDHKNNKCTWGFYLGETNTPRNSALVMGYLSLEYIFEVLKIRKLCGEVFAFNSKSAHFHERLGFYTEGRLIKHVLKNGNYEDVICMALFKSVWTNDKEKLAEICFSDGT